MSRNHTRLLRLEVNAPRIENAEAARQYERDMRADYERQVQREAEDQHGREMAAAYGDGGGW